MDFEDNENVQARPEDVRANVVNLALKLSLGFIKVGLSFFRD